jgi:hypothetical protein
MDYQIHLTLARRKRWFSFIRGWLFNTSWVFNFTENDKEEPEILACAMKAIEKACGVVEIDNAEVKTPH